MTEYLLIPFNKKDEIKKDYPIKWDVAKKQWYFDTLTLTPYYSKGNTEPQNGLPQGCLYISNPKKRPHVFRRLGDRHVRSDLGFLVN